jgi:hypothetical protein
MSGAAMPAQDALQSLLPQFAASQTHMMNAL